MTSGRKTVTRLADYFAVLLRMPVERVRTDVNVLELGADSIMLIEAQRWLRDELGCTIEVRQFFEELNTLDRIAAFVDENGSGEAAPQQTVSVPIPSPTAPRAQTDFDLMRAQLELTAEVIEAQNRTIIAAKLQGRNP